MGQIFLDLLQAIKKYWFEVILKKTYKDTTGVYYSYDNIPLRLFFEIAETNELEKLFISGKFSVEETEENWEILIGRNSFENGSNQYSSYRQANKDHKQFISEYILVKAMLTKLLFIIDDECIDFLRKRGYKIDKTNSEKYAESLYLAQRRSKNLITKTKMKQNEILGFTKGESTAPAQNFEEIMANLISGLGVQVSDDITLARYNAYKNIIKNKVKAATKKR